MFNDYIWQTYLNAGGKDVVNVFKTLCEDDYTSQLAKKYRAMIKSLRNSYCVEKSIVIYADRSLEILFNHISNGKIANECVSVINLPDEKQSLKQTTRILYNGIKKEFNCNVQSIFSHFIGDIDYYSTLLFLLNPNIFIPYYFQYNFNVFEKIAQKFEINLPLIPLKRDYEGRFFYYRDICASLLKFREEHHMSPYELCAFLYDFAPKYIGGIDSYIIKDLPEPKSAFFIGGDKDDDFLSDNADTITIWQCSPRAEAGDIAVMYLRSPISAVNSHWRCVSNGFIDPFFYYYMCAYISKPTKLKRVSQDKLEQDKIFKNFPLVKKNMQGINGVELLPSQYNHLMDLSKSNVCRLEYTVTETGVELMCEKDVEDKLIKPLLKKLGYTDKDFEQQVHIEIGNHNGMLIPDFLILPNKKRGQQSAFAIVEAKYNIRNAAEFEEVKIQARSYARQILAKYCIIASKDKLWVSVPDDDYTKDIFVSAWDELNNSDIFSKLFKLIGKKTK